MTPPAGTTDPSPAPGRGNSLKARAVRWVGAARSRYEGSWVEDLAKRLSDLHFFDWTMIFGAEMLWSVLPFIIIVSSLANHRVDGDLSRHIGLDRQGAQIVHNLFRSTPSHALIPILTGLLFSFAGVVSVVASLQVLYERLFEQAHRGWRDFPRYVIWALVLFAILIADAGVDGPDRRAGGAVIQALVTFVVVALFFLWTMHFLLDGRVPWRHLVRPALVTALLWLAFGFFSSVYFSTTILDDSKTYGTIGAVFTFLTWFIVIGYVIVLGAAAGAVWQRRASRTVERQAETAITP
jgi:membrane protein